MVNRPSLRFPKSMRIVHQRDFDRVFKQGRVVSDNVLVIHCTLNDLEHARLGLSISRHVGIAVVRNRWKRLIREAFRQQQHAVPRATGPRGIGPQATGQTETDAKSSGPRKCLDLVVRPRKGASPDYEAISRSLHQLTKRLARSMS